MPKGGLPFTGKNTRTRCGEKINEALFNEFAMSRSPFSQFPIRSFVLVMQFRLLRTRANVWKKAVFLSPSTIQEMWAFMLQNSSSCLEILESSARNDFSRSIKKLFGLLANVTWTPWSLALALFFLWKMFPKCSLFYNLALVVKLLMVIDRSFGLTQASLTISGKDGWDSHIGWYLKGRVSCIPDTFARESRTGLWLECALFKCLTLALG